jgi:glycosyltransferase involved in cell wall biosynthesis
MRVLMAALQGSGVGYYRHGVPAKALRDLGIDVRSFGWPGSQDNLEKFLMDNIKDVDIMHVGFSTDRATVGLFAAARNYAEVPMITDLDDDFLNVPDYNIAFGYYHGGAMGRRVARMHLRISDAVSTSTAPLAAIMANNCASAVQLPNCIIPEAWDVGPIDDLASSTDIRILFAGNVGRYGDLGEIRLAIEQLMRAHSNVRLFFIGCTPDWALQWCADTRESRNNRAFTVNGCSLGTYRRAFKHIAPHVVINPVMQNVFNKSKSHIKAFDAAMVGAAFVCTDWPTHDEIPNNCAIKLSNTTAQWYEALSALVMEAPLRQRMSARLHDWVLASQTIDKHIHKWIQLYEQVIEKGPITDISQVVRPGVGGGDGVAKRQEASRSGHDGDEATAHVRGG